MVVVNRRMYAFGQGAEGQLGLGSQRNAVTPRPVPDTSDVIGVFAGGDRTFFLQAPTIVSFCKVIVEYAIGCLFRMICPDQTALCERRNHCLYSECKLCSMLEITKRSWSSKYSHSHFVLPHYYLVFISSVFASII